MIILTLSDGCNIQNLELIFIYWFNSGFIFALEEFHIYLLIINVYLGAIVVDAERNFSISKCFKNTFPKYLSFRVDPILSRPILFTRFSLLFLSTLSFYSVYAFSFLPTLSTLSLFSPLFLSLYSFFLLSALYSFLSPYTPYSLRVVPLLPLPIHLLPKLHPKFFNHI